ncbi:hypothetical protein Zmor_026826 [Zophobas morio]|uniref:Uncharacterized protein n=1 Tax=Zophobas morio TaxID=2755281 RepID=A0AA38M5W2_9CUCU|nr:hypothetical protein Zmor_026826 [Zophobas morio]
MNIKNIVVLMYVMKITKVLEKVYVAEFENREENINVMKSNKNLKGSSISINDDLTKTEHGIQRYKSRLRKKKFEGKEDMEAIIAELINLIVEDTEKERCTYGKGGIMDGTKNVVS